MTTLMLTIVLFLPNWSAETPTQNRINLVRAPSGQYESINECKADLKGVAPIIGIYEQIYPEKLGYNIAVNIECIPAEGV